MNNTLKISLDKVYGRIQTRLYKYKRIYGIPTGGSVVAAMTGRMVERPEQADVIVDDLVDSGRTAHSWNDRFPKIPFVSMFNKAEDELHGKWLVFPWEKEGTDIEDHVVRLLEYIGEDPNRAGLMETPGRVVKALEEMTAGYKIAPETVLKCFEDGAEHCDEMVTITNIPFYSMCEHHMLPFFGTATVAYIPDGKIMGLSKASRLVDVFGKRLQVQERLTNQVADALKDHLSKDCAVMIRARHMCMECRGVGKQGHFTQTTAVRGAFREQPAARAEFMTLALSTL